MLPSRKSRPRNVMEWLFSKGGNQLHSQLPSECDYLQSTLTPKWWNILNSNLYTLQNHTIFGARKNRVNLPEICWVCLVVLARFTLYPNIFDFAHKDVMRDCQPLSVWPDREFIRPISTVVNQGYVMLWNSTYLQILTLGYRSVEMVKVAWNWENVPAEAHRIRHLAKICEST